MAAKAAKSAEKSEKPVVDSEDRKMLDKALGQIEKTLAKARS